MMILLRGVTCGRTGTEQRLGLLRRSLRLIDRELMRAPDPDLWLKRAAALARHADPDPAHGRRVGVLAGRVALALGWSASSAAKLMHAAELHDIGKFALPRSLLLHDGPLDPDQRKQLVLHTHAAGWLLGGLRHPVLRLARIVARGHHERWNGQGYPDGAAGTTVPLPARVVGICDVWDALTHSRPYRAPLSHAEARQTVLAMAGAALDPNLTLAFLRLLNPCASTPPPAPI